MHQVTAAESQQLSTIVSHLRTCSDDFAIAFTLRVLARDPRQAMHFGPQPAVGGRTILIALAELLAALQGDRSPSGAAFADAADGCVGLQPFSTTAFSHALLETLEGNEKGFLTDAMRSACSSALIMLAEFVLARRTNRYELAA